jgi:hypothetical protein
MWGNPVVFTVSIHSENSAKTKLFTSLVSLLFRACRSPILIHLMLNLHIDLCRNGQLFGAAEKEQSQMKLLILEGAPENSY